LRKPAPSTTQRVSGWKLWCFRLLALVVAPVVCLGVLELGLRFAGYGHPTAFLLPTSVEGKQLLVQNNKFGWRFFGPQMARTPCPIAIPRVKRAGTIRIFVFGESAAYGDPQPRFGLPRMLEALLSLRHPGVRFEVVNAAMTAINSHAILPIARNCARADGDIWVIYMGNNEVVGPFGAGTVFGPATPPLPVIRAGLAFRATRTGQWLDSLAKRMRTLPEEQDEWGGMMMFTNHQVPLDDLRLNAVYHHFQRNLDDIVAAGRSRGAGIVVSTVAVNLKDCAPFASAHREDLSEADKLRWEQIYQRGIEAQQAGRMQDAAARFGEAARLDERVAELRFRQGTCALALGQIPEAQRHFQAARDLDTLRFRCDSRLNDLIRKAAAGHDPDRVLLADAERTFAEKNPDGLPGQDLFYEHVHLTFGGDYLLARTIAEQVEKLMAGRPGPTADRLWPSADDCAHRLAWTDWDLQAAVSDIFSRLSDPPFSGQLNHAERMRRFATWLQQLAPALQPAGISQAQKACAAAVATAPDDPWLHAQLTALKRLSGDLPGAEASAQRMVSVLPSNGGGWSQLGLILAQQQQYERAVAALRRAFELDSQDVWSLQNLAQSLTKLGRREEAMREYRRALAIKPRFGLAWLGLGQLLEEQGRKTEAEDCYRRALANRIHRAPELTTLARFCQSRGWFQAAATNFADAVQLNPADAMLRLEAGQSLAASGRHSEAAAEYAEAVRLAPDMAQAHFLQGLELGRKGQPAEAAEEFREAVRLMPDLLEARLNLGIALVNEKRADQALVQFQEVLRRSPTNALALHYIEALRPKP
jgi:tetratricopeptide (TPR) repeat protein